MDVYRPTFPLKQAVSRVAPKIPAKKKPSITSPKKAKPIGYPRDPLTQLNPAQIAALARTQVQNMLTPQRVEIQRQREAAAAEAAKQARVIQGFAEAMAAIDKGISPQVNSVYQGAAQTQGALGQGYSGAIKDALANVPGAHPTETADVTSYLGGYIPGTTLNEQGAAASARAALLPDDAMRMAKVDLGTAQNAALTQDKQFAQQMSDLAKQSPELYDKVMQNLTQNEISKANMRIQRGYLRLQTAKTAQDQADALTDITGTLHVVNKNGKVVDTGQVAPGSHAYKNVNSGSSKQAKAKAARAKSAQAREDDIASASVNINKAADGFVTRQKNPAYDERRARILGASYKVPQYTTTKLSYGQARQKLWNTYGQPLMRYASGKTRAKLRARIFKVIDGALESNGIKPPRKKSKPKPQYPKGLGPNSPAPGSTGFHP